MMLRKRKRDKKQTLSFLRRYLNGENLIQELLPQYDLSKYTTEQLKAILDAKERGIEAIEGFVFVDPDSGKKTIIEKLGDVCFVWPDNGRSNQAYPYPEVHEMPEMSDGTLLFKETKNYPDPEIEGISYSNPENVPVIEGKGANSAGLEIPEHSDSSENQPIKGLKKKQRVKPSDTEEEIKDVMKDEPFQSKRGVREIMLHGQKVNLDELFPRQNNWWS
jgi:hypothetical protein